MSDEHFYHTAAEELRLGTAEPALVAKAFAKANGEDGKARAVYMELRVVQLQADAAAKRTKELAEKTANATRKVFKLIGGIAVALVVASLVFLAVESLTNEPGIPTLLIRMVKK